MSAASNSVVRRRFILRNRLMAAGYVLLFAAMFLLTMQAHQANAFPGDIFLAQLFQAVHSPVYDLVMQTLTWMGFAMPSAIIVGVFAAGFWVARRRVEAFFVLLTFTGDGLNLLVKLAVARPRPSADAIRVFQQLNEYSFPSAHVTHYVVFYGLVFYLFWTLVGRSAFRNIVLVGSAALVLLIGPSRIYLGAHWPSDVLGAYLLGGLWLAILIEAYCEVRLRLSSSRFLAKDRAPHYQ